MKKISVALFILTGFSYAGYAQNAAKAKVILAEVTKKYRMYDVVKADFTFTVDNPKANVKQTEKGTLYVKANANKYKMTMKDREMISDGKSQWNYLKDDQEVQLSDVDNSSDALNPAQIFTMYEKGYTSTYAGESKTGTKVYQLIDLKPVNTSKSYNRVRLNIDKAAKQVAKVLVYDKNGSKYTYTVNSFVPNVKMPASTFTFDAKKYPGVEVVDLR